MKLVMTTSIGLISLIQTLDPKNLGLGSGSRPKAKTQRDQDSEFLTFWYRNQKEKKIFETRKIFGSKNLRKIKKIFFKKFQDLLRPKRFFSP